MDQLSTKERQRILDELEADRQQKVQYLQERRKVYEEKKKKREAVEKRRLMEHLDSFKQEQVEREAKKVETLKKWLALKEQQARDKQRKEIETIQVLFEDILAREKEQFAKLEKNTFTADIGGVVTHYSSANFCWQFDARHSPNPFVAVDRLVYTVVGLKLPAEGERQFIWNWNSETS